MMNQLKKKQKETDFDNQSDNEYFVDIEGEEVEDICCHTLSQLF